jgi:GT2 family glycosyltransferase/glycosyltransferase involved in cell wall biosynthesis
MQRFWEPVIEPIFEIVQPKYVVEIGSDYGYNTEKILGYCMRSKAKLHVIDPLPKYDADEWQERYGEYLVFHKELSLDALPSIDGFDAVLIDGDHNWYTVFNELKVIESRCEELSQPFPLVMIHDVGWPYGRRDLYYAPETIPEAYRKPHKRKGMHPDSSELLEEGGLNQRLPNATRENEPQSGVLTATEDFLKETSQQLELLTLPVLSGLAIIVPFRLKENAALGEFLGTLKLPEAIARLAERTERDRLEMQIELQEDRIALRKLKNQHEKQVKNLREQQRVAEARISQLQRSVSKENQETASPEIERLASWIEQLDAGVSLILNSRRWKLGHTLGQVLRRVLRKPPEPAAPVAIQQVRKEFNAWRNRSLRQKRSAGAAKTGKPEKPSRDGARPAAPYSSNTHDLLFVSSEYVLDTLWTLQPVTIVVPIHNAYEDLERCLKSLVDNTTAPAELLLIDDASTDPRVSGLLSEYETLNNVRVLRNEENLGFVRTVNRGFSECAGDVVLLNSDAEVTPRWLENLILAAHGDPQTATATAVSDNAGAFSVPIIGKKNDTPERLGRDDVGRLVTQRSGQVYPRTPTGNGFCMYVKRAALDEVGSFDAESFPRGYGEENDFCMRAQKLGWNHVVDDATFVFHRRNASFGDERKAIFATARTKLNELQPDYTLLARAFLSSADLKRVGQNVGETFGSAGDSKVRPRVLFVIQQPGVTSFRNEDLMNGISEHYSSYLLTSTLTQLRLYRHEPEGAVLLEEWDLRGGIGVTEYSRPDYREIVFGMMVRHRFELVHIWHLIGHTLDLPEVAARLRIPVVLSFNDFYFSCPTVHLIDDHGKHCGGICTPGHGQCALPTPRLQQLPVLKHAYLGTWREQVQRMFDNVDAFVTTSMATRDIHLRSLPALCDRPFNVMEHGRDIEQAHSAARPGEGPIKIVLPGNINHHKGGDFVRDLKRVDTEGRLEFHILGRAAAGFEDLGVDHGLYPREEFNDRVREISPSFIGIFSVWPETYCHTLTEAWGAGIPVLASDIGTLKERVEAHGGGWLLDFEDPEGSYRLILEIASDREEYDRELKRADLRGIKSVREMAKDYESFYQTVLGERKRFKPRRRTSRTS